MLHVDPVFVSCGQAKDKTLQMMPGMWHVLTKEEGNDIICAKIIQWASERL